MQYLQVLNLSELISWSEWTKINDLLTARKFDSGKYLYSFVVSLFSPNAFYLFQ